MPPAVALVLVGASWASRGARRTGWAALAALVIGLAVLQIHAGWRTIYLEGDIPKDMLIYTQTSPDVARMVRELGLLSAELTGGKELTIWEDHGNEGIAWPLQWYLRDFTNRDFFSGSISGPPGDAAVLLVADRNKGGVERHMDGYTAQHYILRWWFPEYEIYRNFAIAPELDPGASAWKRSDEPHDVLAIARSIRDSLATQLDPEGQQRVYRLLMYRDLPTSIDGYGYTLYVRNDLVPLLNGIRY